MAKRKKIRKGKAKGKRRKNPLYRTKSGKFSGRKSKKKLHRSRGGGWSNPCGYRYHSNPMKVITAAFNVKTLRDVVPIILGALGNGVILKIVSSRVPLLKQQPLAAAAAGVVSAGMLSGLVGIFNGAALSSKVLLGGVGLITTKLADTYLTPMIASAMSGISGMGGMGNMGNSRGWSQFQVPHPVTGATEQGALLSGVGDYVTEDQFDQAAGIDRQVGDYLTTEQESAATPIDRSVAGLHGLSDLEDM